MLEKYQAGRRTLRSERKGNLLRISFTSPLLFSE